MTWQNENSIKKNYLDDKDFYPLVSYNLKKLYINDSDENALTKNSIGLKYENIKEYREPPKKPKTHADSAGVSSSFSTSDVITLTKNSIGLKCENIKEYREPPKKPKTHADAVDVSSSFSTTVLHYSIFTTPTDRIEALRQYTVVMQSADRNPAILYKLRDSTAITHTWCKALTSPGRIYKPLIHNWDLNSVWMLAHIHRQSEFMVMSPVTSSNVMRSCEPHRYSAFAREITTAMLAGYQVTKITYQHQRQITYLSPSKSQQEASAMTIMDCRADAQSCQTGLALYQTSLATFQLQHPATAPVETAPICHAQPDLASPALNREDFYDILKLLNTKYEVDVTPKILFKNTNSLNRNLFFNIYNETNNAETVEPTRMEYEFLNKAELLKTYVAPKQKLSLRLKI
jgi:hypothetical protein